MHIERPTLLSAHTSEDEMVLEVRRSLLVKDDDPWYGPIQAWKAEFPYKVVQISTYRDPGLLHVAQYELYERTLNG